MIKLLNFENPDAEKNFREKQNNYNNYFNRVVFYVGFVIILGFYMLFGYFFRPESYSIFITCVAIGQLALLISIIVSIKNIQVQIVQVVYLITILALNISVLVISTQYKGVDFYIVFAGFICLVYACLSYLRIFFSYSILFGVIIILTFELIIYSVTTVFDPRLIMIHYIFYCTLYVSLYTNYNLEKRERHNFIKLQIIVADRLELARDKNNLTSED